MRKLVLAGITLEMLLGNVYRLGAECGPETRNTLAAPSRMPRVRPNGDLAIATLLDEAARRSPTFRGLVQAIDASDGIVYVEPGRCGHHVRACLSMTVHVAGPNRILRIAVGTRRDHDDLLASIGHELRHAIEALGNPRVTNGYSMHAFFDRIGATADRERFETDAAIQAGLDVHAELRAAAR